jgi:Ricin-type beta-trefoil lectin domain-like/Ricin-type beta-trefoil lectin domain
MSQGRMKRGGTKGYGLGVLALLCTMGLWVYASPAAALPAEFYGMQWSGNYDDHNNSSDMEAVQRSGAKVLRVGFSREWTQRGTPQEWNVYDGLFTQAWEKGIRILPYLYEGNFPTTTGDLEDWEDWVGDFYARYGDEGGFWVGKSNPKPPTAWEVWNEPNFGDNGVGKTTANVEKYVDFLKRTSEVIRSGPGNPQILFGGLYWNLTTGWSGGDFNYSGKDFLWTAQKYGAGAYFDGLSLHPYVFGGTTSQEIERFQNTVKEAAKDLGEAFPGQGKTLWITELGWPVEHASPEMLVSEADQKQLLAQSFGWLAAEQANLNISAAQWLSYQDLSNEHWAYHSGLRQLNGQYRSAWWAYLQQTGAPVWPYPQSATTTTVEVTNTLNGKPGWVTVGGEVKPSGGAPAINEGYADVKFWKYENGWNLKNTVFAPLSNSHFSVQDWTVGKGHWKVGVEFREQGRYLPSSSLGEPTFDIRDGYQIVAKHSGKCLDVSNSSTANSALLVQWDCGNPLTAQNQVFSLLPQGGATYMLVARHSGRCVDVYGGSQENSAQVDQYTCMGAAHQIWKGDAVDPEYGIFRAKHSEKCLDVYGANTANGAAVDQYTCVYANNQLWKLKSVDSGPIPTTTSLNVSNPPIHGMPGYISLSGNVNTGAYDTSNVKVNVNFAKEVAPGVYEYKSTAQPTLSGGNYQVDNWGASPGNWRIQTVYGGGGELAGSSSGYSYIEVRSGYRFKFRHSGKCMTETTGANGSAVIQAPCNANPYGTDGQVFGLLPSGNNHYMIKFNWSGRCLDVYGNNPSDGGLLDEYTCIGASNQLWQLIPISGQPPWFALQVQHSGKCVDVPGQSQLNVQLTQYWCYWGANQQGEFQAIK